MYNITRFTIICEFVTRPCAVLFVVDYNDATTRARITLRRPLTSLNPHIPNTIAANR